MGFAALYPSYGLLLCMGLFSRFCVQASNLQLAPRHAPIRLKIALARRLHHAGRQRRRRRVAVPAAGAALAVEIIAQRLLVEAWLRLTGLVEVDRPEARRVRRHHLV